MTVPAGAAVLALVGDVSGAAAADVRAKAAVLLDYPHVAQLVVDVRGTGVLDAALLADIRDLASGRGKSVVLRE